MKPLVTIAAAGLIALGALAPLPATADSHTDYVVRDGMAVYYAIVPAAQIRLYPKHSPEATMHGGVPKGRNMHHLMVALFDADTLARISDATVFATIAEPGLVGKRTRLEPMIISNALTYGNYVRMRRYTEYRVRLAIRLPGTAKSTVVAFSFRPR